MGTHLATGIIQKMLISKKDIERKSLQMQDIEESLQRELNLLHYVRSEKDEIVSWKIKPEMLEGNFAEFLEMQFKMYKGTLDKEEQLSVGCSFRS